LRQLVTTEVAVVQINGVFAKNISTATLRDMIRRATNGANEAIEQLTEFEAGQFIHLLQKPRAA
jgi:hypothetical protein